GWMPGRQTGPGQPAAQVEPGGGSVAWGYFREEAKQRSRQEFHLRSVQISALPRGCQTLSNGGAGLKECREEIPLKQSKLMVCLAGAVLQCRRWVGVCPPRKGRTRLPHCVLPFSLL